MIIILNIIVFHKINKFSRFALFAVLWCIWLELNAITFKSFILVFGPKLDLG